MRRFSILGFSGFGREMLPLERKHLHVDLAAGVLDLVFVDYQPSAPVVNGGRVLTYARWLAKPACSRHMNVAISNRQVRQKLVQSCRLADGVQFYDARAANVVQLDDVQLSEGEVLCHADEQLPHWAAFSRPHLQLFLTRLRDLQWQCALRRRCLHWLSLQAGAALVAVGHWPWRGSHQECALGLRVVGNPARPLIKN
jgi:hypothetical protein